MSDYLKEREKFFDTLKVGELIEILGKYPKEMRVLITWESTLNEFTRKNIYESVTGTLYLDGDYNFYKQQFAKNPKENE